MHAGFETPWRLLLLVPLVVAAFYCFRREEKSYLAHPWAEHLRARLGSGRNRSHVSFGIRTLVIFLVVCALAEPWWGFASVKQKETSRMIGMVIDVSGSMSGQPLNAAMRVVRYLITERPDDRINVAFFASEANYTAFGIPASYLTEEEVKRRALDLGGSTVATHGLFAEFVAIAREDGLLTEAELAEVYERVRTPSSWPGTEVLKERRQRLAKYLDALLAVRPPKKDDRLVVMVTDCDLSYNDYDIASVLMLYRVYGIRMEVVCIGTTDLTRRGGSDVEFVKGIAETGGHVAKPISIEELATGGSIAKNLQDVVSRMEKLKPREVLAASIVEKRPLTDWFYFGGLGLLTLAEGIMFFRRYRVSS